MYAPNTILELKEPKSVKATKTEPAKIFAYDQVRVIGPSPVTHSGQSDGEWDGVGAQGVIVTPLTEFAGNLDEPLGRLQRLYKIVSEPEDVNTQIEVRTYDGNTSAAGQTPEEVFADASEPTPKSAKRVRSRHSPLQEMDDDTAPVGPLADIDRGIAKSARERVERGDQ